MNRIRLRLRVQIATLADAPHACVIAGRLLLAFISILLPAMLWTEHLTAWDRFLQGGQDCELSILALFTFLCLVLLLAQRCNQSAALQLALRRSLLLLAKNLRGSTVFSVCEIVCFTARPADDTFSQFRALPLRI